MELQISLFATMFIGTITIVCMGLPSARIASLRRHGMLLSLVGALLCGMCLLKILFLDHHLPVPDQEYFDSRARDLAASIRHNGFVTIFENIGTGNRLYPLLLACMYLVCDCPPQVMYIINGSLAFIGLLSLLETIAETSGTPKVPVFVVLMIFLCPTIIYYTAANLKEGANLWAVCMSLKFCKYSVGRLRASDMCLGLLGLFVLCLFRAHFAASWILAMGFSTLITQRKIVLGFCLLGASAGAIPTLMYAKPALFEEMMNDGLMEVVEQHYEKNKYRGGSAISHFAGGPIPVISGLTLLMFRPYPWEVFNLFSLITASEVWVVSSVMIWGWWTSKSWFMLIKNPMIMTGLVALLVLSFFFSYQYNMGLMVRHRIQAMPALYLLAIVPLFIKYRTAHSVARYRSGRVPPSEYGAQRPLGRVA